MEVGARRNQVLSSKPHSLGIKTPQQPQYVAFSQVEKGLELRHKERCVSGWLEWRLAGKALEAGGDKALSSSSLWSCFPTTAPIFPVFPLPAGHTSSLGPLPGCPSLPFITTSSRGLLRPELLGSTCPGPPTCVSTLHTPGRPRSQVPKYVPVSPLQTRGLGMEGMAMQPNSSQPHSTARFVLRSQKPGLI